MAVSTPVILAPVGGEIDLTILDGATWLVLLSAPATGDTATRETRVQVATDSGFTALVYDSQLREDDGQWIVHTAEGELHEIWPALFSPGVRPLATYHLRAQRRTTSDELSSFSATVSVATIAGLTGLRWRYTQ